MQENEALTIETISIETLNESNQTTTYTTRVVPTMTAILEAVYPVGAIFISAMNADPSVLFGFGTWQQVEDRFLLAAGSTYEAGSTGGEAEHTLIYKELPETNGVIILHNAASGTNIHQVTGCFTPSSVNTNAYRHGGTLLEASGVTSVGRIDYTNGGEDKPHNNMPPYLAVYVWQRIE